MDYSKAIKEYREKLFLTQEDLGKLLNVSKITVNRWENGKFEPTMKIKRKLHSMFLKAKIIEE